MTDPVSVQVVVYGRVQGVFFRAFVSRKATQIGLTGYVRNLPGGSAVEVQAEGERQKLAELLGYLKIGPPGAMVASIETKWSEHTGSYSGFSIRY